MSVNLYWSIKNPNSQRLPNELRDVYSEYRHALSTDFLRGFLAGRGTAIDPCYKKTIEELIEAIESGKEVEFEIA